MGNFEWDDGKIGLELKFKVLKNSSCKKIISPSGGTRDSHRDEEEILNMRVSN